jgi:hypothetical protein
MVQIQGFVGNTMLCGALTPRSDHRKLEAVTQTGLPKHLAVPTCNTFNVPYNIIPPAILGSGKQFGPVQ